MLKLSNLLRFIRRREAEEQVPDLVEDVEFSDVLDYLQYAGENGATRFGIAWDAPHLGRFESSYMYFQAVDAISRELRPVVSGSMGRNFQGVHKVYDDEGIRRHRFEMRALSVEVHPSLEKKTLCSAVLSYQLDI